MNILFYQYGLAPVGGGIQRVTYNISKELCCRNINCYVAFWNKESLNTKLCYYKDTIYLPLINKESRRELARYIRKNHITVVVNQCAENKTITQYLYAVKEELSIKLYSYLHLSPTSSRDGSNYFDVRFPSLIIRGICKKILLQIFQYDRKRLLCAYNKSEKLILLSERFKEDLISILGENIVQEEKLFYITNSCSFDGFFDKQKLTAKKNLILVVSRMVETNKRISISLDLWRIISKKYPDWKLVIIGDGPNLKDYKKISEKYRLSNIFFEGNVNPLPYYQEASLLLMTSLYEGFGMTLLESHQMGVVPVALDTYKSLHDIVENGYNGLIVKDKTLSGFQAAVESLINNTAQRRYMARNAIESSKKFLPSLVVEKWIELLNKE